MSSRLGWGIFAVVILALTSYQAYTFSSAHALFADFRAFWCAGSLLAHHGDPYHAAPMLACERGAAHSPFYSSGAAGVLPAPLPGYALALFVPFASLPYAAAAVLWFALTALATVLCSVVLASVTRAPRLVCAWLCAVPALVFWLPYGEITPVAMLGALVAAFGVRRARFGLAALGFALIAAAPHLAAPVWLTAAILLPRLRMPLLTAGAVLCALWALSGSGAIVEYVRQVLPLHALAELPRASQYSLAWAAFHAGLTPRAALLLGSASSLAMLAAGIAAACALARKRGDADAVVLVPLAAAVIGGTFVHAGEIVAAMPLALWLTIGAKARWKLVGIASLVLLTAPFDSVLAMLPVIAAISYALAAMLSGRAVWGWRAALPAALLADGLLIFSHHDIALRGNAPVPRVFAMNAIDASASWGREIWATQSGLAVSVLASKLPMWLGLVLLVCGAAHALARKDFEAAVRVDDAPIRARAEGAF